MLVKYINGILLNTAVYTMSMYCTWTSYMYDSILAWHVLVMDNPENNQHFFKCTNLGRGEGGLRISTLWYY